jgi:hypothetical protein
LRRADVGDAARIGARAALARRGYDDATIDRLARDGVVGA